MSFALAPLEPKTYRAIVIDPPWRFAAGVKSRPQHYGRMTFDDICALPVRDLLHPDGGRVFLWITAPLLDRIGDVRKAWRLRYSSAFPWIKVWPKDHGPFLYRDSLARGTGLEVVGNAEYVAILKSGTPQSIKGRPFAPVVISPRREHSRKPVDLHEAIEARLSGPFAEIFARETRPGWAAFGNQSTKFNEAAE